jgi:hypothetical protein
MWRLHFRVHNAIVIIKPRALIITGHLSDINAIIINW